MSPQEKAKEVVDKFARIDGYVDSIDMSKCEFEKQCALIAVDEIVNFQKNITDKYLELSFVTFWTEVKQEIEKL